MLKKTLLCLFCVAALLVAKDFPRPCWLHYPEPDTKGLNLPRYFWTDIIVKEGLQKAVILYHLDDSGYLIIDGKQVEQELTGRIPGRRRSAWRCMATALLPPGTHRIELMDVNAQSAGGILCKIVLTYADGSEEEFFSRKDWLAAQVPSTEGGLEQAVPVSVHGDLNVRPFGASFDVQPFFSRAEVEEKQRKREERDAFYQKFVEETLSKESYPVSRIVYEGDTPVFKIGNESYPAMFYCLHMTQDYQNDKFVISQENFRDANLHLYVMGMGLGQVWVGPGQYNFKGFDSWLPDVFYHDPDARLLFCIASGAPGWWMKEHPEECVEYLNTEETSTAALDGRHRAPSFASEIYQKDLCECLKALVAHIDTQPWGKRVFAIKNDNGVSIEWHHWGMKGCAPDVSAPMQRRFKKYLRERYGSDEALQAAWGRKDVTLETARLADYSQRTSTSAGCYWDPVKDGQTVDSVRCVVGAVADCILATSHAIKEGCNSRCLVGNFYGYFFGMGYPAVGWHLDLQRMLQSKDIDFNCAPCPYGPDCRDFGQGQYSRSLLSTYRLYDKLCIMEADTRSHDVAYGVSTFCYSKNPRETVQLMARDFSQALCSNIGFWYYDFCKGWYTAPEVREYLQKLRPILDAPVDRSGVAEVVLVGDMNSIYYQAPDIDNPPGVVFFNQNRNVLAHTGVPFDAISIDDVENPRLKDYKVYVFLNALENSPERIAMAQRLRDRGKTIVWLDKAGYLDLKEGASVDAARRLTGFTLKEIQKPVHGEIRDAMDEYHTFAYIPRLAPWLAIEDDGQLQPMGWNDDQIVIARKANPNGGWSYLAAVPALSAADYKAIFREAGVHCYCDDEEVVIYANKSYLMLHLNEGGQKLLSLPRPCRLVQLLPEEKVLVENAVEYAVDAEPRTTYLFRME